MRLTPLTPKQKAAVRARAAQFAREEERMHEVTPEELAELIGETYERLAPDYGFEGRRDYWRDEQHRRLMTAVAREVLHRLVVRGVRLLLEKVLDT